MRLALLAIASLSLLAQSGEEILGRVDRLRHPWPAFSVELAVTDGTASQRWKVSARENGDARVDGLSEKEKGRSVLMLGDQMWLLLPGSKRPLKVTPQQRMMGPAAGGDVARTRFREDYQVERLVEEVLEDQACWKLELEARRPSVSARRVQLWVAKEGSLPLRAEFRLASGKLARTVDFDPPAQVQGQAVLTGMTLTEANGTKVALRFGPWTRGGLDPALFVLPDR